MYRSLHPFKGEGWQIGRILKSLKGKRENLQSNVKVTGEIMWGEKVK